MKEIDEQVKNYPDEFSTMSAKAQIYKFKNIYSGLKTIDEKLNFIVNANAYGLLKILRMGLFLRQYLRLAFLLSLILETNRQSLTSLRI